MNQKFTKNLAMRFLLVFTLIASFVSVNAQLITYPASAVAITRGLDSTILTARIDFPAGCTSPLVTVNLGATNTPGLVQYIPGSITVVNGVAPAITTPGYTITESNISNLNKPVFAISPNPTSTTFITFTLKRRANCGTASATKDVIAVTGGCAFSETDAAVNTYNLVSPALTIVPPATITNANVGVAYNRTINVTNGGNGCLDTLGFWLSYAPGTLQLNSLKIGATTLTPVFQNADSAYYRVTGTTLSADKLLCNGETVVFTENVTVLKCNSSSTYGTAWYEHISTTPCQAPTTVAGIIMSSDLPTLSASMVGLPVDYNNYCMFAGEQKLQTVKISNTGAGAASNVSVTLSSNSLVFFDTTLVWNIKNSAGTIVGVFSNFTGLYSGIPFTNTSCVVDNAYQQLLTGTVPANVFIPAGDFITIEIPTKVTNFKCPDYECRQMSFLNIGAAITYKSQCATSNFVNPTAYLGSGSGSTSFGTSDITAPLNVTGTPPTNFTLDLDYGYYNYNYVNGTGVTYLAIPLLGTGLVPNGSATIGTPSYPMTYANDTLFIALPQFAYLNNQFMSIPLTENCSAGSGEKTINIFGYNKFNGCGEFGKMYCGFKKIYVHCPGGAGGACTTGGATPTNFSLKRINFGQPDNDQNSIPDPTGTINPALVKADRSVNGDTLQGRWDIKIYPNTNVADPNFGANIPYVYIDADIRGKAGDPLGVGYLSALPNAQVTIYPASGGAAINCTVSPTILAGGSYAHYEMGTACRGGFWQANDSIVVKANYTVNVHNASRSFSGTSIINTAGFYEFKTANEVYSSYTQKTTQQIAPIAGQTYTCDHYNEINNMAYIDLGAGINGDLNGCAGEFQASSSQSVRNSEANQVFPYEYRNFYIPKKYKVTVMPGAKIIPGSAYFQVPGNVISAANITQIADTIIFDNLNIFYTPYGGSIVPPNGGNYNMPLFYRVQADCGTTTGSYYGDIKINGIGNGVNTPSNPNLFGGGFTSASSAAYIYKAPQPVVSGSGTVYSTDGSVTWNVVVQNQSNTTPADFSWFSILPNGFTNIVVKEGATTIAPVAAIYQLGSIPAASTRTFTVTAKLLGCNKDSIIVDYGTTCNAYPTDPTATKTNCRRYTTLIADNYPSQIQLTVAKQPVVPAGSSVALCAVNTAEFVINSALGAFVDNPAFLVVPPTGATITGAQMEYPLGSGNLQTVTPTIASGLYTYKVEDHSAVTTAWGTKGLPGTLDNPLPAGRQAKLIVTFTTDCNFTSGSKLQVRQQGSRPCGTTIPTSLGYNNAVRTEPINITGAGGTGAFNVVTTLTPTIVGCNTVLVTGSITPVFVNSTASDTVVINLPEGITYQAGFSSTGGLTIVAGYPQAGPLNSTILKLKVPNSIGVGTALPYQFNVKSTATSGCGNFSILQEVERSYPPLFCGAIACPNASKAIIGADTKSLVIDKMNIGSLALTNLDAGGINFGAGTTAQLRLSLKNESSTIVVPANTLQVQFYCGPNNGFGTAIGAAKTFNSAAIATGATAFADFTLVIPTSPTCLNGQCIWAVITPNTSNCTCDQTSASLCPLLPIDFEDFTAKPVANFAQLNWKVANDYNAKHYEVEQSVDGRTYKKLATIPSTNVGAYSYLHTTPNVNNYYRIKALDIYGVTNYSVFRQVNFAKSNSGISVFPNPSEGLSNIANVKFPISLYHKAAQILFYSADGKLVLSNNVKSLEQVEQFNIANFANGIYNIIVISESEKYNTKLIVSK